MERGEYTSGIMEELRGLLLEGMSSGELIDMGYAPGTGYKVQRQVLRQQGDQEEPMKTAPDPTWAPPADQQCQATIEGLEANIEDLEVENDMHRGWIEVLEDRLVELDSLGPQLEVARARIQEMEIEAQRGRALEEQVRALETHGAETEELVFDLARLTSAALENSTPSFAKLALKAELDFLVSDALSRNVARGTKRL